MKPLLEIKNMPIAIEFKTSAAQVTRVPRPQQAGGATGTTTSRRPQPAPKPVQAPAKVARPNVDTVTLNTRGIARYHARKPAQATVSFYDEQGNSRTASYDATAQLMGDGQVMVDLQLSAVSQAVSAVDTATQVQGVSEMSMMDGSTADLPQTLSLTYELEKMQYDMRQSSEGFEFTPASIEFSSLDFPRVIIEYVGSPLYVPPSADPDYEPIDVEV